MIRMLILSLASMSSCCPVDCKCEIVATRVTVKCNNLTKNATQHNLKNETEVHRLKDHNWRVLKSSDFCQPKYILLEHINLSHGNLSDISPEAFISFKNLLTLDLSYNQLTSVPKKMFSYTSGLKFLSLKRNQIHTVKAGDFLYLNQLKELDLSFCKIYQMSLDAFSEFQDLERLAIEGNQLTHIDAAKKPVSLQSLTLHDNPWSCDCGLQTFRNWLVQVFVPLEPTCHTPDRLSGFAIRELGYEEFACLPVLTPTYLYLTVKARKDVSFMCRVKSEPRADITWTVDGVLIDKNNERLKTTDKYEGLLGTRSELYITNSSITDNGTFVCTAENKAGKASSKFDLHVVNYKKNNIVVEVRQDQFVAIVLLAVTALALFFLIVIILSVKLALSCYEAENSEHQTKLHLNVPRYQQSDISFKPDSRFCVRDSPDILAQVCASQGSDTTCTSIETDSTTSSLEIVSSFNEYKNANRVCCVDQSSIPTKHNFHVCCSQSQMYLNLHPFTTLKEEI